MPQDRESGRRANEYGRKTAKRIAQKIGGIPISTTSNEFRFKGRKITIRCAHYRTNDVGMSYKMLERIDAIIAALEQQNGKYKLFEISPQHFKLNMRPTKSKGSAAGKVSLVKKSIFTNDGKCIAIVKL